MVGKVPSGFFIRVSTHDYCDSATQPDSKLIVDHTADFQYLKGPTKIWRGTLYNSMA